MYEIVEKKVLSETVKLMKIKALLVAKKAKDGQLIPILRKNRFYKCISSHYFDDENLLNLNSQLY